MAITTYAELKTALADWSHRSDLTSYLDDFIDQTESFFKLPPVKPTDPGIGGLRANITRVTGTLSGNTLARPSDFLEAYKFEMTGTNGGVLEFVGAEELGLRTRTGNGKPRFWTVSDVIELDVTPDFAYPYTLSYYPDFAALDGSTATNWVLDNHPDAYLSGCMFRLSRFIQDREGAASWLSEYKAVAHGANKAYQRSRYSQGPIASKVG